MLARLLSLLLMASPLVAQAQTSDLRIGATVRPPGAPGAEPPVALLDLVIENVGTTTEVATLQVVFPQRPPPPCHQFGPPPAGGSECRLNSQVGGLCALSDPQSCMELGTFPPGARLSCTLSVTRLDPTCPPLSYRFIVTNGGVDATPPDNFVDVVFGFTSPSAVPMIGLGAGGFLVVLLLVALRMRQVKVGALYANE